MKKMAIRGAALLAAIVLLAGCTATAPEPASSSAGPGNAAPSSPAPAPTVTVTVTATPEPTDPASAEMPAPPVMSSADAIDACRDYQSTAGTGSKVTGEPYAFLTHDGSWLVVVHGENEYGPLYISCVVGGDPEVAYGESDVDMLDPSWFDGIINGHGGL